MFSFRKIGFGVLVAAVIAGAAIGVPMLGGGDAQGGFGYAQIVAGSWTPSDTGGAGAAAAYVINNGTYTLMPFEGVGAGADECAEFSWTLPQNYVNGSPLRVKAHWTVATGFGGAAETVQWDFFAESVSNDAALGPAWGAGVAIPALTWTADEDLYITDESGALTIGNTASRGDSIDCRVCRDLSEDTMQGDALFKQIKIKYVVN